MKKIVFILQTTGNVVGPQELFLKLANYLAKEEKYEIYYVADISKINIIQLYCEKLNIIDIRNFDTSGFEDAIFFAPLNYLGHLLSIVHELSNAKVCLYDYNASAIDWLCYNMGSNNKSEIEDLIDSSDACAFLDKLSVLKKDIHNDYSDKVFLPYKLIENDIEYESFPKVKQSNEIRVGFVGNINSAAVTSINNLINNIISQNCNQDVTLHLIGNANAVIANNFRDMTSTRARIIYTGELEFDDLKNYLQKNVDLVIASDIFAINASLCGVPVVIPITNETNFNGNHYVWIFDTNYNMLKWDSKVFETLDYDNYTLKKIFNIIYDQNLKQQYAKMCYDFVIKHYSIKNVADNFIDFIDSSKLTVGDCLRNNSIKERMDEYILYKELFDKNYNEFINYKKNIPKENLVKDTHIVSDDAKKFYKVQDSYKKKKTAIIKKYKKQKKISVGFIVVFNSVFPIRPVFELMLNDNVFDPYIVVAPDVACPKKEKIATYNEAYYSLSKQYPGKVLHGYNSDMETYVEFKDKFDIVFFCNPYKSLVHKNHDISYFLDKNVLPIYASYGFAALSFWDEVIATDFYNYLWKACVETESNLQHLKDVEKIHGINGVVTGYIKVDKMANIVAEERKRKRVIICPHHTVWGWKNLNISNFLKYKDFFLELPKMFPDVDFVFRPHPLLFPNMINHMHWSQNDVDEYLEKLLENPNATYDTSGEYFDKFVNSDAMIHDCGSFIGEYLYTEKPCCYMMKNEEETMNGLVPLGQQCMQQYYHAFTKEDIVNFIQNVVINGNDSKKEQREKFVQTELKKNYPHAAESVIKMIKNELNIK